MRFSLTTRWLSLKVRLIVAGLIFSIGFYCGVVHKILTQAFWPGSEIFAGIIFFFGFGLLMGFSLLELRGNVKPLLKYGIADKELHPVVLARIVLPILAVTTLAFILLGNLVTFWLSAWAYTLPERFLLVRSSWRILAFMLPVSTTGLVGVFFALVLGLTFAIFVYLECPNHRRSEQPQVQQVIVSVLGWVLLTLTVSWAFGFYLTEIFVDRWWALVFVPVICCLSVIVICLVETAGESDWFKHVRLRDSQLHNSSPELAGRTSRWAGFAVSFLGWLVVWNAIHWNYALSNWFGLGHPSPDQSIGLVILAALAAGVGIKLGFRYSRVKPQRYMTIADRQGYCLVVLGISLILFAVFINHIMKAPHILTIYPPVLIPILLAVIAALWGISLGLTIPALAVGRPSRFDLWIELMKRIITGAMLAGPLYLLWQYAGAGNLLAISFASLLAIAFGGVVVIYNESPFLSKKKKSKSAKFIHVGYILILYLGLGFIMVLVPHLKSSWLKPSADNDTYTGEGLAGVAYLLNNGSRELIWANRISFPERTVPALRQECEKIVTDIVKVIADNLNTRIRAMVVNLPALPAAAIQSLPVSSLEQFDIDSALRNLELKSLGIEQTADSGNILDLYCRQRPSHVVIAMLPQPWPNHQSWPSLPALLKRLVTLSQNTQNIWIIYLTKDNFNESKAADGLLAMMKKYTGCDFEETTIESKTGYRWHILTGSSTFHNDRKKIF
ncbi:MAG: hypothetical protein WC975_10560 [Phycisphaerae bacterium]